MSNLKFLTSLLLVGAAALQAGAFESSYYTAHSALSSGRWVKISVAEGGMRQISYDRLRLLGFDNPAAVAVYGYSATELEPHNFSASQPDDLTPVTAMHTADGRLIFYADGEVIPSIDKWTPGNASAGYSISRARNSYDTRACYFLSDVRPGASEAAPYEADFTGGRQLTSHLHIDFVETEVFSPSKGGTEYFGPECLNSEGFKTDFRIRNFAPLSDSNVGRYGLMSYRVGGTTEETSLVLHSLEGGIQAVSTSRGSIANATETYLYRTATQNIPFYAGGSAADLADAEVSLTVKPQRTDFSFFAGDWAAMAYPRANSLDTTDPSLIMHYPVKPTTGRLARFDEPSATLHVWAIDGGRAARPLKPLDVDAEDAAMQFPLPADCRRAVAFDTRYQYAEPDRYEVVANQDLHAMTTPEMVIITTDDYVDLASELADLHRRYQDMEVAVVPHQLIFNEFSSGARSFQAYRRFVKMLYDRDPSRLKNVLLFGVGSYDNRGVTPGTVKAEQLLTYQITDAFYASQPTRSYCNDAILGMVADNYDHDDIESTLCELGVGRIPARNMQQARAYVDKCRQWFENPPSAPAQAKMLLASGNMNENQHISHQFEVRNAVAQDFPYLSFRHSHTKLMMPDKHGEFALARNQIAEALRAGVGYFTFSGHGAKTKLGLDAFNANSVQYNHYSDLPFIMFSSCSQFAFDNEAGTLLEEMLFKDGGGCIAGVASCRTVYLTFNQVTCLPVARAWAQAQDGDTFGDVYRNARAMSIEMSGNVRTQKINNMCYNLGGDPALPVYRISRSATVRLKDADVITPLSRTTVTGCILQPDDNGIDTDFNGDVWIEFYDGRHTEKTVNSDNEGSFKPMEVTLESDILTTVQARVVAGEYQAEVALPAPTYSARNYRVVVSAVDPARRVMAGDVTYLRMASAAAQTDITEAPRIVDLYVSDASGRGDEVGPEFTVVAVVDPSVAGINTGTAGIQSRPVLTLDNGRPVTLSAAHFSRDDDGMMTAKYRFAEIEDGRHSVRVSVVNNVGLATEAGLDFQVVSRDLTVRLTADETAETSATIDAETDLPCAGRLMIADADGRTVFSAADVSLPYEWNLKDDSGRDVPDGLYRATMLLRDARRYGTTTPAEIVVVR